MCNVACAVTVTMDRSLGWQGSVPVKVSVTLSCVVIVMGLAHAVPAAAKATKAASMNVTMMRLTTHLLSSTEVNKGERKGRTPKEPDSRLTAHYIVLARRTLVTRLLVPSAL